MRRLVTAGLAALLLTVGLAAPAEAAAPARAQVRVDQGGYLSGEAKYAYLMSSTPLAHPSARLVDTAGRTVLSFSTATASGGWNQAYPDVYRLSFGQLRTPGRYRLRVSDPAAAVSPWFTVSAEPDVYSTMLRDGVSFDQVQRDGADVVPGPLHRRPSHLNDRHADVYATPTFDPDSDTINEADLTRIGGPVDVSGGWYDAGDYLKLTHSTAYNDILLFASARSLGAQAPAALSAEARYGLQWLGKMWDAKRKVLYIQVGVGTNPGVAIDEAGNAVVAWQAGDNFDVQVCVLPAKARACAATIFGRSPSSGHSSSALP